MPLRRNYVLLYLGTLLLGFLLIMVGTARVSFPLVGLGILVILFGRLIVNYRYGKQLNIPMFYRVLASIFSSIGFFYLMGYDTQFKPSITIIQETATLYEQNYKTFIRYSALLVLEAVAAIALVFGSLKVTDYLPAPWDGVVAWILITVIVLVAIYIGMWITAALIVAIEKKLTNQSDMPLGAVMRTTRPMVWRLIGLRALRGTITVGPLAIVLLVLLSSLAFFPSFGLGKSSPLPLFTSLYAVLSILLPLTMIYITYFTVRFVFGTYSQLFNEPLIWPALKMSLSLTRDKWWVIFWRLTVAGFIVSALSSILSGSIRLIGLLGTAGAVVAAVLSFAFQIFILPLSFIVLLILFNEAKRLHTGPMA